MTQLILKLQIPLMCSFLNLKVERNKMRSRKNLVWICLAVLIASVAVTDVGVANPGLEVYVDPHTSTKPPGDTFDINIMVSGAVNLFLSDFFLVFDPNILEVTDIVEGDFEKLWQETISNTIGFVQITAGRELGVTAGLNGTLSLAKITFQVKTEGTSFLHLHGTVLKATSTLGPLRVEYTWKDGYFAYPSAPMPPTLIYTVNETHWSRNVTIESSSTISNFNFSREDKEISFDVEGPSGIIGFSNVLFRNNFIFGNYTILLDGESLNLSSYIGAESLFPDINYRMTENAIYVSFYLAYYHESTRKIQIRGTEVIPEIPEPVHDIAVTNVAVFPTTAKIGDIISINVTVVNLGTFTETFNVTAYYDTFSVGPTETVTNLDEAATKTLEFSWDTANVTLGVYEIMAVASNVTGETEIDNNEYTFGLVTIEKALIEAGAPTLLYAIAGILMVLIVVGAIYIIWRARKPKPT